jgi:hypothetical protein
VAVYIYSRSGVVIAEVSVGKVEYATALDECWAIELEEVDWLGFFVDAARVGVTASNEVAGVDFDVANIVIAAIALVDVSGTVDGRTVDFKLVVVNLMAVLIVVAAVVVTLKMVLDVIGVVVATFIVVRLVTGAGVSALKDQRSFLI